MTDATYLERVDRGIAKANGAAPDELKAAADRILRHVLTTYRHAHSGLFWAHVYDHEPALYGLLRRHSYMVNGRWKVAAKEGLCRQTADRHPTWLASAHPKEHRLGIPHLSQAMIMTIFDFIMVIAAVLIANAITYYITNT